VGKGFGGPGPPEEKKMEKQGARENAMQVTFGLKRFGVAIEGTNLRTQQSTSQGTKEESTSPFGK